MNSKKNLLVLGLFGVVLGGCFHTSQSTTPAAVDLESINETVEGRLGAANSAGEYSLQTQAGPVIVHDGNATLQPYVGQTVRLTGQYSGTTLYVDRVEVVQ